MIQRQLLENIRTHLDKKEITIITGARQSGKTTIIKQLAQEITSKGGLCVLFNLDIEKDFDYFTSQEFLLNKIQLEIGKKGGYVFIDEIQRKENAGLFLKGLWDMDLPYKFIVTGSGSLELKDKIHESLLGRKRIFELETITFPEFVDYKTNYKYKDRLHEFFQIEKAHTELLINEYMGFGGYPRVIIEDNRKEKLAVIEEIYNTYIDKDISYLLQIDKPQAFRQMIRLLAHQTGQIINHSQLALNSKISSSTINKYLWYAEKTFVIQTITPFSQNFKKEITKSPVVYFNDLGFRKLANSTYGIVDFDGFNFQNFIFKLLHNKAKLNSWELHFWRTTDKAEVDFVIDTGNKIVPIEVKYSKLTKPQVSRSLHSFIKKYNPPEAWLVNLDYEGNIKINSSNLKFLPFYSLLNAE